MNVFFERKPRRPSITHNTETQNPDSAIVDIVYRDGARSVIEYIAIEKVTIKGASLSDSEFSLSTFSDQASLDETFEPLISSSLLDASTSDDVVLSNETIAPALSLTEEEESDVADKQNTEEAVPPVEDETDGDSVFIEFEETLLDDLLAV